MQSIEKRIFNRIKEKGSGWAFTASDFKHLADRSALDVALYRLAAKGEILRALRGVYYYPEMGALFKKAMPPDVDSIAKAIARRNSWRIQITGMSALNYFDLSTQVQGKITYLSDGPTREYKASGYTLTFKNTKLKESGFIHRETELLVQALKALGESGITEGALEKMRDKILPIHYHEILEESKSVTQWVYDAVKNICKNTNVNDKPVIITDESCILAVRIKLGEVDLIFDTSALMGIKTETLANMKMNGIRMMASPYCAFEGIRHIDDPNKFLRYKWLLKKIDMIGVAHLPTYESSLDLGIHNLNRSKSIDRQFAAAISKYGSQLEFSEDLQTVRLVYLGDGRQIQLSDLVQKMRNRIIEMHSNYAKELIHFRDAALSFLEKNLMSTFQEEAVPQLAAQAIVAFHSKEPMESIEIEAFMRYYPHIGGMLYRNFLNMNSNELGKFTPPANDGIDYRFTLHAGMDIQRILVSDDRRMHLDPLRAMVTTYNKFISQFENGNTLFRDIPLVISSKELVKMRLECAI